MSIETYFSGKKQLAFILIVKDEINKIRKYVGLPEYSDEQIMTAYKNKLNGSSMWRS